MARPYFWRHYTLWLQEIEKANWSWAGSFQKVLHRLLGRILYQCSHCGLCMVQYWLDRQDTLTATTETCLFNSPSASLTQAPRLNTKFRPDSINLVKSPLLGKSQAPVGTCYCSSAERTCCQIALLIFMFTLTEYCCSQPWSEMHLFAAGSR